MRLAEFDWKLTFLMNSARAINFEDIGFPYNLKVVLLIFYT